MDPYGKISGKKPAKKIHKIETKMSHDGKMIHTHMHHFPEHHADETHVSNNMDEMQKHMSDNMPNMTANPPDADAAAGPAPAALAAPGPMAA